MARKGNKHTIEHNKKISSSLLRHKVSKEIRKKISKSLKGRFIGIESPCYKERSRCINCGKSLVVRKAKRCVKCNGKYHRGEHHYKFTGYTPIIKLLRYCFLYRQWRSSVFERDNWTCQTCQKRGTDLEAHHLKDFSIIVKSNNIKTMNEAEKCLEMWDIGNGVTLCKECHNLTKKGGCKTIKGGW